MSVTYRKQKYILLNLS